MICHVSLKREGDKEFRHAQQRKEAEKIDEDVPDIITETMINEGSLDEARELSPEEYNVIENEERLNQQELKQIWDNTFPRIP